MELSEKGFEDAIRSKYGGQVRPEVLLKPKRCWGCGELNQSHASLCSACGRSLDSPAPGERERKLEVLEAVLQVMRERNPDFDRLVQEAAEQAAGRVREILVCKGEMAASPRRSPA